MNTYLVVYYGSVVPTFSYAETLKQARLYALFLLNGQYCKRSDVLSIVDVVSDRVIYHGKRDELLAEFIPVGHPTTVTGTLWPSSLNAFLNWVGLK